MSGRFRRWIQTAGRGLPALPCGHAGRVALPIMVAMCAAHPLFGAEVHVVERAEYDGTIELLRDQTLYTGTNYVTQVAPKLGGYIFTHWSTTATEGFAARDVFGRSFDAAPFTLYDNVTLTAHYVEDGLDSDGDGVADGYELYWYGDLGQNASSDTDGDGMTFAEELAAGTNPLFADRSLSGVSSVESSEWLYNPSNYHSYVIRSEPEGELFTTVTGIAKIGDAVTTPTMDRLGSFFAYWKRRVGNNAPYQDERDAMGRAADKVSFVMPDADVELVAVAVFDDMERASLYWYGVVGTSALSDTDGDGITFADEVRAGTNPLFPDRSLSGVASAMSAEWLYNPSNYHAYVFRSEPEDALFETVSGMAMPGTSLATPVVDRKTCFFAYWTRNGERVADALGRAMDQVSFTMPNEAVEYVAHEVDDDVDRARLYWYGDDSIALDSDTDCDGMTFEQEIKAGTNPLFPDRSLSGIVSDISDGVEMNLQPFEQVQGAVVGGAYSQMFTSPVAGNAATSTTFGNGGAIWPVVADLNDDGLWDLVVVSETTTNVFVNVGSKANPEFEVDASGALVDRVLPFVDTNSVAKLASLTLDVPSPEDALSATVGDANQDGVNDLLVSDGEGRIWYYAGSSQSSNFELQTLNFTLQHKVWGGSYAGFAQGLRLAAVDWEDDGDLDCLAGTADGKLMLLRDPKAGRPTNLKAVGGVDNILLSWDPNAQSRIRGYRLYRAELAQESETTEGAFARIAQPQLPTHRDFPTVATSAPRTEYAYKVSSVSRFYTAGNSTPTETESVPTDIVRGSLGVVSLSLGDAAAFGGTNVEVSLSIENSLGVGASCGEIVVMYDSLLTPVDVKPSGLTENAEFSWTKDDGTGTLTIHITSGTIDAGSGTFFTLVFETQDVEEETTASVLIDSASLKSTEGADIIVTLPEAGSGGGTITIMPFDEDEEEAEDVGKDLPKPSEIPDEGTDNNIDDEDVENNDDVDKEESQIEIRGYGGQAGLVVGIAKATVGKTESVTLPVGIRSLNFSHWWGGSGNLNVLVSHTTFKFTYDPVLLEPTGVEGLLGTSWTWSAEKGILTVKGQVMSGNLSLGCLPTSRTQYPIKLTFRVLEQYSKHEALVGFGDVTIATTSYRKVYTPIRYFGGVAIKYTRPQGDSTIVAPYSLGDVNGDGRLTKADLNRMANIVGLLGIFATRNEIRAGDYNGNGWLEYGDYQLMRQHFRRLGIVANGESGQGGL